MVCDVFAKIWTAELIIVQDSIDFRSAILDDACGSLDSLEDSRYQRCSFVGLANKTCHHCWVCLVSLLLTQITYTL